VLGATRGGKKGEMAESVYEYAELGFVHTYECPEVGSEHILAQVLGTIRTD
jgi:hypothetical protein